jgi:ribulose-bisphosphate carboxylase large chain
MNMLSEFIANQLWHDTDAREEVLRRVLTESLAVAPPPIIEDAIVATYFFALRSQALKDVASEIAYHATTGIRKPPPNSLLSECTGYAVGVEAFDKTGRLGLLHMAYPLKMLLSANGHLTSTDILHTTASAIIFDVYENQDARLIALQIPDTIIETFPGPAYGAEGVRRITNFPSGEPMFGTILKPTAGIVPEEVGELVRQAAACPLLAFIKEDENLYPNLPYSPVAERTKCAMAGIEEASTLRGERGLLFAPHITAAPHEILTVAHAAVDAGATALMFSESFAGGAVRMVREAFRHMENPPAIYGHNAGIGVRTRSIWREVLDLLARLDGIDFRQTAPVKPGPPFLRPYGEEWKASEHALTRPLPGIAATMIARAGGLDQGNIGLNLADAEALGLSNGVLFLAGSAINSVKNKQGKADSQLGLEAMQQAIEIHRCGTLHDVSKEEHLGALVDLAERTNLTALCEALRQRYPQDAA